MITRRETAIQNIEEGHPDVNLWSDELRSQDDLMKLACRIDYENLFYVNDDIRGDKKFMQELLDKAHNESQEDYPTWNIVSYASKELRNDKGFMMKAIKDDCSTLQRAGENLLHNKGFILQVLRHSANAYIYIPEDMQNIPSISLEAAKLGTDIILMPENMMRIKEIVLECMKHNPNKTFWSIPFEMQKNKEIFKMYFEHCRDTVGIRIPCEMAKAYMNNIL